MPKQIFVHNTKAFLACGGNHYFELITYLLSKQASRFIMQNKNNIIKYHLVAHELCKMLTAIIIVARVQPGTSKGITDLLLPQPSSGLKISQRSL